MLPKDIRCKIAVWMGAIATTIPLSTTSVGANELTSVGANELTQVLVNTPLQLQLKTLDRRWKRLSLSQDSLGPAMLLGMSSLFQSALRTNIYYTQGQTVTLGKQKYLVVYRPEGSNLTFTELIKSSRNTAPESLIKELTPNTGLVLSLINLANIESLQDIQPFDLQKEIRESKQALPKQPKSREKPKASPKPMSPSPGS